MTKQDKPHTTTPIWSKKGNKNEQSNEEVTIMKTVVDQNAARDPYET